MTAKRARNLAFSAIVLIAAAIWIFPLYWALTTSLRSAPLRSANASGSCPGSK